MARPRTESRDRVTTAIRFDRATHEALKETAEALTVGVNWLVNRLVEEGLARMDLSDQRLSTLLNRSFRDSSR